MSSTDKLLGESWPDSYVKGGSECRFSQSSTSPDTFVGYGADKASPPRCSWFDLVRTAVRVLSAKNTLYVLGKTDKPGKYYLSREVPSALDYFEKPFKGDTVPYNVTEEWTWSERQVELTRDVNIVLVPGEEDEWAFVRSGESTAARPVGTWWELMRLAALVLSSPNTEDVLPSLDTHIERQDSLALSFERGRVTDDFDGGKPYQFAEGVRAGVNPNGAFDF